MKPCKVQSFTVWAESVKSRALQFPGWFGKSPAKVLIDVSISSDAKVLHGILALKTYKTRGKCNVVSVTTRELAALLGKTAPTISTWLKQLEIAGHIEKLSGRQAKSVYRLASPAFDYRVRVETAPGAVAEVATERLPVLRDKKRRCPKCKVMARIESTSGVCADCLAEWVNRTA